jgi:hypothetical protein
MNRRASLVLALGAVTTGIASQPANAQSPRKATEAESHASTAASPSSTAHRFLTALLEARIDDARSLLADLNTASAPTTRDLLSLVEAFRYQLERGYEVRALETKGDLALVEIKSRGSDGTTKIDSMPLVREQGQWRVALREKPASVGYVMRSTTPERDSVVLMMKADLRDLATFQEAFFADSGRYAAGVAKNRGRDRRAVAGFVPSAGVEVEISAEGKKGWRAVARHTGTERRCAMFVGVLGPVEFAALEGDPGCSR